MPQNQQSSAKTEETITLFCVKKIGNPGKKLILEEKTTLQFYFLLTSETFKIADFGENSCLQPLVKNKNGNQNIDLAFRVRFR